MLQVCIPCVLLLGCSLEVFAPNDITYFSGKENVQFQLWFFLVSSIFVICVFLLYTCLIYLSNLRCSCSPISTARFGRSVLGRVAGDTLVQVQGCQWRDDAFLRFTFSFQPFFLLFPSVLINPILRGLAAIWRYRVFASLGGGTVDDKLWYAFEFCCQFCNSSFFWPSKSHVRLIPGIYSSTLNLSLACARGFFSCCA